MNFGKKSYFWNEVSQFFGLKILNFQELKKEVSVKLQFDSNFVTTFHKRSTSFQSNL